MTHLIACREYPPAPYPAGGIGTYVNHIARLMAARGETVHLIAQQWDGARARRTELAEGKLIIHRVSLDEPVETPAHSRGTEARLIEGLRKSDCPSQTFAWQAARLAEILIESEPIDVIEGQDWEAPLYYLQVRRALGLGPRREPPCLVHLHSPSQLIFEHNSWDQTFSDYQPLKQLEEYTIRAADALVCPSRYLARQAEQLFALESGAVEVIPYPMGNTPFLERAPKIWKRNSISYFGRLELRKGVVEWIDAAVHAARSHADVKFEFTGSDTSLDGGMGRSVQEFLASRIPRDLRHRFEFHGVRSQQELFRSLAEVCIAVVPSRWDNLPFSCIEAMATGLPVIVSPNGGMRELIQDSVHGWLAADSTAAGLECALRAALDAPPDRREAMGAEAAATVRRVCDNESVVNRHLDLRGKLAARGAGKSRTVPGYCERRSSYAERRGLGVVITCFGRPEFLPACLESLVRQVEPVEQAIVVIDEKLADSAHLRNRQWPDRVSAVFTSSRSICAARLAGANQLLAVAPDLRAIAFLTEEARLDPIYAKSCNAVFERHVGVGLVIPWVARQNRRGEPATIPCVVALSDFGQSGESGESELAPGAAVRTEALLNALRTREGPETAGLLRSVAREGWSAVAWPGRLAFLASSAKRAKPVKRYSVMALAQNGATGFALKWFVAAPWAEKARWLRRTLKRPARTARWVGWQSMRTLRHLVGGG